MNGLAPFEAPPRFTEDAIEQQLGRIFMHPDFSNSEILRKFLSFVVRETCSGNANRLKEYTIAVKALEKPSNFNPQSNCIVRIHAGRLRKALTQYYNEMDWNDEIIIGLPKGKYVPVFMDRQQWLRKKKARDLPTFAILPFHCTSGGDRASSFIDNLCLQICSALSQMKEISVIGYQAVKSLTAKSADLDELGAMLHFDHLICGGLQYSEKRIRVNIQVIECNTYQQIWSKIFECSTADSSLFDIQDEICRDLSGQASNLTSTYTLPPKFESACR